MTYPLLSNKFADGRQMDGATLCVPMTNPEKLRVFLGEQRWSQSEFAKRLRVSVGAVSQWVNGKRAIPGPVWAYIDIHRKYKFLREMYEMRSSIR